LFGHCLWRDIFAISVAQQTHYPSFSTFSSIYIMYCLFRFFQTNHSEATKGSADEECLTEGEASKACMEYGQKLDQLSALVEKQGPIMSSVKSMADEIKKIKLAIPQPKFGKDSPELQKALAYARKVTEEEGIASSAAKVAWGEVEEISAAGISNSLGGKLTSDECLLDAAQEACEALDELNRVLSLSKEEPIYKGE
jgi:hypothetical protein